MKPPIFQTPPPAQMFRLATAARMAGMTPSLLLDACQRGDVPVSVFRAGERGLWLVNGAELLQFLAPRTKPSTDLFS